MKPYKPSFIALAMVLASPASALAASTESQPVHLDNTPADTHVSGGGSIVRTIVGLAVVIGVIYGLYWVLKQVKSSREEKAVGQGLAAIATLPLGAQRSLQLVRAGREIHLVGVSEHGVTPVKTYTEDEAEAVGLLDVEETVQDDDGGAISSVIADLRRRTVRR
jgi:flagellar protein FliO/FliZ